MGRRRVQGSLEDARETLIGSGLVLDLRRIFLGRLRHA
jgi:hypothetical protein